MTLRKGNERKYRRQRERLLEDLRERGIADERVLEAVRRVERHHFIEPALRGRAYEDEALPIGMKQTISQPFTVAYQTMLLNVQRGDRILEIGTGSGYQAAVLCELGVRLFSIERHGPLLDRAKKILDELGYRVVTRCGDGSRGWPALAPFDGIVVTAGARETPDALLEQLRSPDDGKRGGRLIIPVGGAGGQTMYRYTRTGPYDYDEEEMHSFRFVPLVADDG